MNILSIKLLLFSLTTFALRQLAAAGATLVVARARVLARRRKRISRSGRRGGGKVRRRRRRRRQSDRSIRVICACFLRKGGAAFGPTEFAAGQPLGPPLVVRRKVSWGARQPSRLIAIAHERPLEGARELAGEICVLEIKYSAPDEWRLFWSFVGHDFFRLCFFAVEAAAAFSCVPPFCGRLICGSPFQVALAAGRRQSS